MNYKHGDAKNCNVNPIHNLWREILKRCSVHPDYKGRGIIVCEEWLDYINFKKWVLKSEYKKGLSIDRINNNGNYEPSNCRFTTKKEQARNRRSNRLLTIGNKTKCLAEWCELYKTNYSRVLARIDKLNWSIKKALTQNVQGSI